MSLILITPDAILYQSQWLLVENSQKGKIQSFLQIIQSCDIYIFHPLFYMQYWHRLRDVYQTPPFFCQSGVHHVTNLIASLPLLQQGALNALLYTMFVSVSYVFELLHMNYIFICKTMKLKAGLAFILGRPVSRVYWELSIFIPFLIKISQYDACLNMG